MQKITTPRLIAAVSTLFFLYVVLPMKNLIVYKGSELKGILFVFLIATLIYWSFSSIIGDFFKKNKFKAFSILLTSGLIAVLLCFPLSKISELFFSSEKQGFDEYLAVGDYLRDIHGINIYLFDFGGWLFTKLLLICFLLFGICTRILGVLFSGIFEKKK